MSLENLTLFHCISILVISALGALCCDCGCGGSSDTIPSPMKTSGVYYPPPDPYEGMSFVVRPAELPKPTIAMPSTAPSMYRYDQPQPYMIPGYIQQQPCSCQQKQYKEPECSCMRKLKLFQKMQAMKERFEQQRQMIKYQLSGSKPCGCPQKHMSCGCRDY